MQIFYNVMELIHTGDMTPVLLVDLMTLNSIENLNLLYLHQQIGIYCVNALAQFYLLKIMNGQVMATY
jgi:hypothetical protein